MKITEIDNELPKIKPVKEIMNIYIDGIDPNLPNRNGFIYALIGSIIGLVVDYFVKNKPNEDTHVKCPDCRELIIKDARKCKHCGCNLVPQ